MGCPNNLTATGVVVEVSYLNLKLISILIICRNYENRTGYTIVAPQHTPL